MNNIINYIWSNGLIPRHKLRTTGGKPITILASGEYSQECGCFTCASISIDGEVLTGTVVVADGSQGSHIARSNAVLCITTGSATAPHTAAGDVAHINIDIDDTLQRDYNRIASAQLCPLCSNPQGIHELELHSNLSRLLIERIEQKAAYIISLYEKCDKKWDDTLFKLLARSFGFGIQGSTFESWANTLNLTAAAKHRDNPTQIEAIFFGQAGLLEESTIPSYYLQSAQQSQYYQTLVQEYKFLSRKFDLRSIDGKSWGFGHSTPHLRIARLATLYAKGKTGISTLSECNTTKELTEILHIQPEGYWRNHTQFGSTTTTGTAPLKNSQAELLIINTVVPMLYAYGKHRHDAALCEKAEDYLHTLNSESNSIIKWWASQGVAADCAADSQALIQLHKEYCNRNRCLECCFAKYHIKKIIGANNHR